MTLFSILQKNANHGALSRQAAQERPLLLRYACSLLGNRDDAEDAVQDLLERLCNRCVDEQPRNPMAYLYRSLHNLCADRLRRQPLPTQPIEAWTDACEEETPDSELHLQRIQSLLTTLPQEQATVIRLRFYGGKSFAEISEMIQTPLPTVKSRFRYGMEKLRNGMCRPTQEKPE